MVDAITAAATTGAAAASSKKLATDFDDFLTLLTTQLQNQDPLDPMDSAEFTNQLVAFSGVEQQIQANQNLETLANLARLNNLASGPGYLGRTALVIQDTGDTDGTGITWRYNNETVPKSLVLEVRDPQGKLVYSEAGETKTGTHVFAWDGKDTNGEIAQNGEYKLTVIAKDDAGAALSPTVMVEETITAVDMSGFEPVFTIGPNEVGQTEILQLIYGG